MDTKKDFMDALEKFRSETSTQHKHAAQNILQAIIMAHFKWATEVNISPCACNFLLIKKNGTSGNLYSDKRLIEKMFRGKEK